MNRHNYEQPQNERGGNRHLRQQILEGLGQSSEIISPLIPNFMLMFESAGKLVRQGCCQL